MHMRDAFSFASNNKMSSPKLQSKLLRNYDSESYEASCLKNITFE